MTYQCPVCGYPDLAEAPRTNESGGSYEICPSCGFQFGVSDDDLGYTDATWRNEWIDHGMSWWSESRRRPDGWDPERQLRSLQLDE
jgi:hypothetical protein